jgi:hypothetical protein
MDRNLENRFPMSRLLLPENVSEICGVYNPEAVHLVIIIDPTRAMSRFFQKEQMFTSGTNGSHRPYRLTRVPPAFAPTPLKLRRDLRQGFGSVMEYITICGRIHS